MINIEKYINIINKNKKIKNGVQKNRSKIKYSKKKIRQQKGLGKSRIGSRSSPILRGGARAFPGKTEESNNKIKINKKLKKKMFNLISNKNLENCKIADFKKIEIYMIKKKIGINKLNNKIKYFSILNTGTIFTMINLNKNNNSVFYINKEYLNIIYNSKRNILDITLI